METEADGIRMRYPDEGAGPPVVLLHGYPLDRSFWAPQVRALRGRHRVLAPDLRGCGGSPLGGVRESAVALLAAEAAVSARHLCFVETGRASPSRAMVLKLAAVLDVPLRERNALLLAAGFAPVYEESPLDAPALAAVRGALDAILAQQEPYPAVVMDRDWDIERTNEAARRLFGFLLDKHPPAGPGPANVLRLMLHPGGVRPYVTNWPEVAAALVERMRREALGGATDERARRLLTEALAYPGVPDAIAPADAAAPLLPIVPVRFAKDGRGFAFFSAVTTLGTPQDVTLQELRIESFFPADDQTRDAARRLLRLPGEEGRAPASG